MRLEPYLVDMHDFENAYFSEKLIEHIKSSQDINKMDPTTSTSIYSTLKDMIYNVRLHSVRMSIYNLVFCMSYEYMYELDKNAYGRYDYKTHHRIYNATYALPHPSFHGIPIVALDHEKNIFLIDIDSIRKYKDDTPFVVRQEGVVYL